MNWLVIFIGGGMGSLARYGLSVMFKAYNLQKNLIYSTILANLLACLILAVLVYAFKDKVNNVSWLYPLIGIGFCGGFSTFSTFSLESLMLFQEKLYFYSFLNILVSVISCFAVMYFVAKQMG